MGGRRRHGVWVVVVGLVAAALVSSAPPAASAPASAGVQWSPCHRQFGPYQCGVVQVPLDHDRPNGATISIALIRLPAADPDRRIGSLFVNPGGPGGSGFDLVLFAGPHLFPPGVSDRFDIVGFDPRGVARSTPLRCFGTLRQVFPYFSGLPFPVTDEEEAVWIENERGIIDNCERRAGPVAAHMSTANVARDLDRLRQAVGDARLTYYGVSYGSMLGTTYANLFPSRVRAVGVDSVLDPVKWVNVGSSLPFSTNLGSAEGALDTLREFFRLCDQAAAEGRCAFGPGAEARFEALAARLRSQPFPFFGRDGDFLFLYGYAHLIGDSLGAMYQSLAWEGFAEFLAFLEAQADPATLTAARQAFLDVAYGTKRGFPRYPNFVESFMGVACSDAHEPTGYDAWRSAADQAEADSGHFGRLWTWVSSLCAEWPFRDADRFTGPFTAVTANPLLVVNNRFDPATPLPGAEAVAGSMPGSSLVTVEGWGHGSIATSTCVDDIIEAYLVDQQTPPPGTVCHQDIAPFTEMPPPPGP